MKQIKFVIISAILLMCFSFTGCKKKEHQHKFSSWTEEVQVTCTTDGIKVRICETCGEVNREVIVALGHKEDENSCSEPVMCTVCNTKIKDASDNHKFGEWKIGKNATCELTGYRSHVCTVCNKTKTEIIPELGHNYSEWKVTKKPTCTSLGEQTHTCSNCNEKETEDIDKLSHQFNDWDISTAATCTHDGIESHSCSVCGTIEVKVNDMLDHSYGEWTKKLDATCSSYGVEERKCKTCDNFQERPIEKIDHDYNDNICNICHQSNDKNNSLLESINKVELTIDYSDGLVLPTQVDGLNILWKSLNPDIITNEGYIYANRKNESAVLVGEIENDGVKVQKSFNLKVPNIDTNGVDYCFKAYYSSKISTVTATNLVLLTKNYGDCQVLRYETSNPDVITSNGVINQQPYVQKAKLTLYLLLNGIINKYEREIEVLSYSEMQRVERVLEWTQEEVKKFLAGEITKLPTTHEKYGGVISWFSYEPGIIAGEGYVSKPISPKTFEVSCTIICGSLSRQADFMFENFGGNTKLELISEWMKGQIPSNIMGTKNYVLENDEFDYQIRTNSGGILNLIDGTTPEVDRSLLIDVTKNTWVNRYFGSRTLNTIYHPALSQEILDRMLYTGYVLPNEKQILWITVHESGMPGTGNDARLLAQVQMDTANGLRDREASWNYQVDENKIYQSFEDEVICWHAGDGTATIGNGNNSSIGIEMCVNEDGNYDGAMHMDAKLIAMLLHKYNLSLINVKRHFDWSGKICPNYMIVQGRWLEFLNYVDKEYTAMSLLKDAKVNWTVTTDTNNNTEEVLNTYFTKAGSTTYISKAVSEKVILHITMTVEVDGTTLSHSNDLVLLPN